MRNQRSLSDTVSGSDDYGLDFSATLTTTCHQRLPRRRQCMTAWAVGVLKQVGWSAPLLSCAGFDLAVLGFVLVVRNSRFRDAFGHTPPSVN
jgi:hypothetical protein